MDAMRAMLDELMGKDRNAPLAERSGANLTWDDPSVCKYQLAGLCPSRLFKNTRSDLGPCEYEVHDDHLEWPNLKEAYDKADPREIERYERKLMRYLDDLIRELDRKIAKNRERAEKQSAPRELLPADKDRLADLKTRAKEALEKAEALAEEGEVDAAHQLQQQAEAYNRQHDDLHRRLTASEKTMLVCDVCGIFINSTDNEQRRREHVEGKQYLGWKAIRERQAELIAKWGPVVAGPPLPPPAPRSVSRGADDRDRAAPRSRDGDRDRERDRDRDRRDSRERDYRDRERDPRGDREGGRYGREPPPRDYRGGRYDAPPPSYSSRPRDREPYDRRGEYDRRRY